MSAFSGVTLTQFMSGWTGLHSFTDWTSLTDGSLLWHSLLILFPHCVSVLFPLSIPISTQPIETLPQLLSCFACEEFLQLTFTAEGL